MIYNHLELRFIDAGTPNDPDGVEFGVFVDESRLGKERWPGLQALRLSCLGDAHTGYSTATVSNQAAMAFLIPWWQSIGLVAWSCGECHTKVSPMKAMRH